MKRIHNPILRLTLLFLFLSAFIGCAKVSPDDPNSASQSELPIEDDESHSTPLPVDSSNQTVVNPLDPSDNDSTAKSEKNHAADTQSSTKVPVTADSETNVPETPNEEQTNPPSIEPTPNSKAIAHYTEAQPRLMGYKIADRKQLIVTRYGEPLHKYMMSDDDKPLTVYQYDSFIVGFTPEEMIQFINVTSKHADPGLNGVRLGDSVKAVKQALGTPTDLNEYVLSYVHSGSILKFDIDPQTQNILSIKLFPDQ